MIKIRQLISGTADYADQLETLLLQPEESAEIKARVETMFNTIEDDGDDALIAYCEKFDRFSPDSAADLEVTQDALKVAQQKITAPLLQDIETAAARLETYHRHQLPQSWDYTDEHGNRLGEIVTPVERAVVYAPGGTAAYPSSVLMGVIPAKIAGVKEIILSTPAPQGQIPAVTLAAATVAGCHRVFRLGGAQAILGFALGTDTLPAVDVVVGPGNAYVAEAKRQVVGMVGIDSIAGPSEVLIISDGSAPADWVAADMAAQAEHDPLAQSILTSPNPDHISAVVKALETLVPTLARADTITASLNERGACITAADMDECCLIADDIAPEHLQIMADNPEQIARKIQNAGSIFLGNYASVAFGDYLAGTNHVLPTAGTARFSSPLGVHHFMKRSGLYQATAAGAAALAGSVARLADAEGLSAHAQSARLRDKKH